MDQAMGPFWPLWQFLKSMTQVLSRPWVVRHPPLLIYCLLAAFLASARAASMHGADCVIDGGNNADDLISFDRLNL
jgi:hypothetical protein